MILIFTSIKYTFIAQFFIRWQVLDPANVPTEFRWSPMKFRRMMESNLPIGLSDSDRIPIRLQRGLTQSNIVVVLLKLLIDDAIISCYND